EVARRAQDAREHAQIRPEWRGDAGHDLARSRGTHGHIDGENQDVRADGLGAADKIEADGMLVAGAAIELEPKHVRRDLGCTLDGHPPTRPSTYGTRACCAAAARCWSAPGHTIEGPPMGATPIGAE